MIFGGRRKGLPQEVFSYRRNYLARDPVEVGVRVRNLLFESVRKAGPSGLVDLLSEIVEVKHAYPFNGLIVRGVDVIVEINDKIVGQTIGKRQFRELVEFIRGSLDRVDSENLAESASALAREILLESRILLASPSRVTLRAAMAMRAKAQVVRVPEVYPYEKGVSLAERLYEEGVAATFVPDYMRARIVRDSDIIVAPIYGVTSEGFIITDPGVLPVVEAAREMGKPVYFVGPDSGLHELGPLSFLESNGTQKGPVEGVEVRLFDAIDPGRGGVYLARRTGSIQVDRESIKSISRINYKLVKDTVEALLSRLQH